MTSSCTTSDPAGDACGTLSEPNWNEFKTIASGTPIHGVNLAVPWSSIETTQGGYDFSALDPQIKYYTNNYPNLKVNLMLIPINYSSNGNNQNPTAGENYFTPSYVFTSSWAGNSQVVAANGGTQPNALDVVTCSDSGYAGASGQPTTGYPVVYEAPFYVAYQNFIAAVISHYNGNATIGYMRFGLSVGDETDAYCTSALQSLPAPNTFPATSNASAAFWENNYLAKMVSFEANQRPTMQIMNSLNSLNTTAPNLAVVPMFEASLAVQNGFGFGSNGWQASDIGATACTSDWCALFDSNYLTGVPLELQTATPSDPSGQNACTGVNSPPGCNPTGSLVNLVPTAAQHHATILELSLPDLYLAFEPGYSGANASFAGAYNSALTNACTNQ